jgi:hypothetical protein
MCTVRSNPASRAAKPLVSLFAFAGLAATSAGDGCHHLAFGEDRSELRPLFVVRYADEHPHLFMNRHLDAHRWPHRAALMPL